MSTYIKNKRIRRLLFHCLRVQNTKMTSSASDDAEHLRCLIYLEEVEHVRLIKQIENYQELLNILHACTLGCIPSDVSEMVDNIEHEISRRQKLELEFCDAFSIALKKKKVEVYLNQRKQLKQRSRNGELEMNQVMRELRKVTCGLLKRLTTLENWRLKEVLRAEQEEEQESYDESDADSGEEQVYNGKENFDPIFERRALEPRWKQTPDKTISKKQAKKMGPKKCSKWKGNKQKNTVVVEKRARHD